MKRRLVALAAAACVLGAAPAGTPLAPATAIAKPCSSGWTHAVISGSHKCLRRGQFCARAQDRTYHSYGFHCHKRDARGNYHLT